MYTEKDHEERAIQTFQEFEYTKIICEYFNPYV